MNITKNTSVSIGLVIVLIGGVGWLMSVHFQGLANASDIVEIKEDKKQEVLFRENVKTQLGAIKQWMIDHP